MQQRLVRPRSAVVLSLVGVIVLVTTILIPATGLFSDRSLTRLPAYSAVQGRVTALLSQHPEQTPTGIVGDQHFSVLLKTGAHAGQTVTVEHYHAPNLTFDVHVGDQVMVSQTGSVYYIADEVRSQSLGLLTLAFVGLVLIVGGVYGLRSLVGMALSFLVIVRFIVPGILAGDSPLLISLCGALVIMLATLYVAHGVSLKTTVALLGTTLSLALTGGLAVLAIQGAKLTGIASDEAVTIQQISHGSIDLRGLLLGAFIIGALGILNDVTVTQVSTVFELRRADPRLDWFALYRRGMNVGRDHIASMVNTLFLAYAGASLFVLVLLALQSESPGTLINREFIAVEIVRTLVGSIGIVAAVPVTTILAALAARQMPGGASGANEPGDQARSATATMGGHVH